jgi:Transposase DDE domain
MISKTHNSYSSLCEKCFKFLPEPINKWRRDFIKDVLWLFLSINAPINFLQLGRYGKFGEQRYRQHFEVDFNFFNFNASLVQQHCGTRLAIAFDPSYIPKSGSKTDGVGWYWSGSANQSKWGLEIGGMAVVDLENHTALHLEAVQTIPLDGETLLDFYARIFTERADELKKITNVVVADAYFSKEPFVSKLMNSGLDVISRFRADVRLRYPIQIKKTGKRGRTKTNGDEVDFKSLDNKHFSIVQENEDLTIHTAVVFAVALKRTVRVVFVEFLKDGKTTSSKIYFSTDIEMEATEIFEIYQTRFQIEFIYRDAKQHTSLTTCQARNKEKLDFHFNMALTAVNVAKIVHWYSIPIDKRKSFSMADVKTINHNTLLLERFIEMFAIKPYLLKNNQNVKELLLYGTIAA